jgi:hypothetical protein
MRVGRILYKTVFCRYFIQKPEVKSILYVVGPNQDQTIQFLAFSSVASYDAQFFQFQTIQFLAFSSFTSHNPHKF